MKDQIELPPLPVGLQMLSPDIQQWIEIFTHEAIEADRQHRGEP